MRSGGGKNKGSAFERKVCETLSLWITNGLRKDALWRSAMSGGRSTVARARGEHVQQAGDICSVSPEGHCLTDAYYIECKHYRDLGIQSFLLGDKGKLAKFWEKARSEAAHYKRKPMLIAKQNLLNTIVVVLPGTFPDPTLNAPDNYDIHFLSALVAQPFSLEGYWRP